MQLKFGIQHRGDGSGWAPLIGLLMQRGHMMPLLAASMALLPSATFLQKMKRQKACSQPFKPLATCPHGKRLSQATLLQAERSMLSLMHLWLTEIGQ